MSLSVSVCICLCLCLCVSVCVCVCASMFVMDCFVINAYSLAGNTLLHLFGSWLFEATVWPDFWPAQG